LRIASGLLFHATYAAPRPQEQRGRSREGRDACAAALALYAKFIRPTARVKISDAAEALTPAARPGAPLPVTKLPKYAAIHPNRRETIRAVTLE
jgi:hypothetical protein